MLPATTLAKKEIHGVYDDFAVEQHSVHHSLAVFTELANFSNQQKPYLEKDIGLESCSASRGFLLVVLSIVQ